MSKNTNFKITRYRGNLQTSSLEMMMFSRSHTSKMPPSLKILLIAKCCPQAKLCLKISANSQGAISSKVVDSVGRRRRRSGFNPMRRKEDLVQKNLFALKTFWSLREEQRPSFKAHIPQPSGLDEYNILNQYCKNKFPFVGLAKTRVRLDQFGQLWSFWSDFVNIYRSPRTVAVEFSSLASK